jgi:dihydrofolate synthase/folylpolyglutamate synthase
MRTLAAALGSPQQTFPSILIAGTNGKGSTAATLAAILAAAGSKTALYTSPHLVRVNERIQILNGERTTENGQREIPDHTFARLFSQVDDTAAALVRTGQLPHPPSFFEVLTALAFLYFAEEKVDIAVLEVGLGGRLDATNIVEPLISVITDIALDHQDYLGNTISAIAREKAGILRPNGILVTLPQHPEANQAIGEAAASLNLTAISAADFIPSQTPSSTRPAIPSSSAIPSRSVIPSEVEGSAVSSSPPNSATELPRNRYTLALDGEPLLVDSPLPGHHQQRNLALAITTAVTLRNLSGYKSQNISQISNQKSYNIPNSAIEGGIRNTLWPGRLELLPPNLLLDVAHNPAGAWTLRAAIAQLPESQPRTLLFSCLADKDLTEISRILFPLFDSSPDATRSPSEATRSPRESARGPRESVSSPSESARGPREQDHIVFAPIANPRTARVEDLLAAARALDIPAHAAPDLEAALALARALTPPGGLIIATGSVYLVGAIRNLALATPATPPPPPASPGNSVILSEASRGPIARSAVEGSAVVPPDPEPSV